MSNEIIIIDKTVPINWNSKNKVHYTNLGYKFTKYKDTFDVDTKDVAKNSHAIVQVRCPSCREKRRIKIQDIYQVGHTKCRKCVVYNNHKTITLYETHAKITITNKVGEKYDILVDKEDLDRISSLSFSVTKEKKSGNLYARSTINRKAIRLHRIIMNVSDSKIEVDHINHNTLDNRKSNLRLATSSQNNMNKDKQKNNTSGVRGVCYNKIHEKWCAYIGINNTRKSKSFQLKSDAIKWRKEMEELYFGEYNYNEGLIKHE